MYGECCFSGDGSAMAMSILLAKSSKVALMLARSLPEYKSTSLRWSNSRLMVEVNE